MDIPLLSQNPLLFSPLLVGILVSLFVLFLWLAFQAFRTPDELELRLDDYMSGFEFGEEGEWAEVEQQKGMSESFKHLLRTLGQFAIRRNMTKWQQMLDEAGNPRGWTPVDFMGLRVLSGLLMLGLSALLTLRAPAQQRLFFILTLGLVGYMLPSFWLRRRIKKRKAEIIRAMPDAIDMLTIGVEAGLSFEASMLRVGTQWDNELTRIFKQAVTEIRLGTPRAVALQRMADRTGVQELRSFVGILNQSVQLGISIANVLRSQAEEMRLQRRQRAEELAHQATVKMIFPLVFLIFPALFIVILGPAVTLFAELFSSTGF